MTVVKICGITNLDDALCAVEAGADMLGFIFYPPSPRGITVEKAKEIASVVSRKPGVVKVGVFVKETPAYMLRVLDEVGLEVAQLHGNTNDDLPAMNGRAYLAIRDARPENWRLGIQSHRDFQFLIPSPRPLIPDLLLDANHPMLWGGSGTRADESLAAQISRDYRLLLAGGLTPDNVAEAIRRVKPWGVDVASGVEASAGKKDHGRVRAFIAAAKAALHSHTDFQSI